METLKSIFNKLIFICSVIYLYNCCATSNNQSDTSKAEAPHAFYNNLDTKEQPKSGTSNPSFSNPLHCYYRVTSPYGYRTNPVSGNYKCHNGIDLACTKGTPIYASMNGKISSRAYNSIYGNYVIITHENGYKTKYAHLNTFGAYSVGDNVSPSSVIGYVGSTGQSTGPHCHFEIIKNGVSLDPCTRIKF